MDRIRKVFGALIALGMILSACAPAAATSTPTAVPPTAPAPTVTPAPTPTPLPEKVKIRFAFWGGKEEKEAYEKMIAAFNQAQTEIEVVPLHIPEQYEEKVLTMIGAGDIPDIIAIGGAHIPAFAARGALQDLGPFAGQIKEDIYYPRALQAMRYRGKLWALPFRINTKVMAVNLDLLQEAGIEPPTAEKPWTPEQYLEAARKLTIPGQRWGSAQLWFYQWIHQFGGRVLDEEGKTCMLDRPEVLEAAQYLYDFRWVHNAAPALDEPGKGTIDLFMAGEAAMMTDVGPYFMPLLTQITKFKWALAPQPGKPGFEGSGEMEVVGLAIPAKAKNPEASFKAIAFLTGDPRSQDILALTKTQIPGLKSSGELFAKQFPGAELFIRALDVQVPQFKSANSREIQRIIGQRIIDALFLSKPSAKPSADLFKAVCEEIQPYLEK